MRSGIIALDLPFGSKKPKVFTSKGLNKFHDTNFIDPFERDGSKVINFLLLLNNLKSFRVLSS